MKCPNCGAELYVRAINPDAQWAADEIGSYVGSTLQRIEEAEEEARRGLSLNWKGQRIDPKRFVGLVCPRCCGRHVIDVENPDEIAYASAMSTLQSSTPKNEPSLFLAHAAALKETQ